MCYVDAQHTKVELDWGQGIVEFTVNPALREVEQRCDEYWATPAGQRVLRANRRRSARQWWRDLICGNRAGRHALLGHALAQTARSAHDAVLVAAAPD
jgi:hypothetical protein